MPNFPGRAHLNWHRGNQVWELYNTVVGYHRGRTQCRSWPQSPHARAKHCYLQLLSRGRWNYQPHIDTNNVKFVYKITLTKLRETPHCKSAHFTETIGRKKTFVVQALIFFNPGSRIWKKQKLPSRLSTTVTPLEVLFCTHTQNGGPFSAELQTPNIWSCFFTRMLYPLSSATGGILRPLTTISQITWSHVSNCTAKMDLEHQLRPKLISCDANAPTGDASCMIYGCRTLTWCKRLLTPWYTARKEETAF